MANLLEYKKARANFDILEEYEAGIELAGHEVKSLREKRGSLEGAHVIIRGGEAFIVNMNIPPYQQANTPKEYDPERARRLLLNKKEIAELSVYEQQKGLTIVPFSVYSKSRNIKMRIAAVRGLAKHDKRERIKERSEKRAIERTLKQQT